MPAALAFPLDGRRALGLEPLPRWKDPRRARCSLDFELTPESVHVTVKRRELARVFAEEEAAKCLEAFWREQRIGERTFELPLLLVRDKK